MGVTRRKSAMPRKRKKPSPPHLGPEVITGLEPTQEEKALQELESGTEEILEVPHSLSEGLNTYFIHQEEDIYICSNFLVGRCLQGIQCPRHHLVLPYVWQVREKTTGTWYSIEEGAQLVLERLYSKPNRTQVVGHFQGCNMLIDLIMMTIHDSQIFDWIRRLSTSSCSSEEFHTVYKYYYEKADNVWEECSPDFVKCIEEGVEAHKKEVFFTNALYKYSLDLVNMIQTNLETKTERIIRKRPVFKSPVTMIIRLRALSRPTASCGFLNSLEQSSRDHRVDGKFPKTWSITNSLNNYEKKLLTCAENEYLYVYNYFHKTMGESEYIILEISRIQNYFQWKRYKGKRKFMARNLIEFAYGCLERYLFHGTSFERVEAICNQNFDPRVSGKNATLYGKGSYFATEASYAHRYSAVTPEDHHYMFLAKVLVGHPALGDSSYTRPPPLNANSASSLLYDSCVNRSENPDIFIVFANDQCYPYFIIKYRKMTDFVCL